MKLRYIDTRPRAPSAVFDLDEVLPGENVRLKNIETRRTILVPTGEFRQHYEGMQW